MKKFLLFAMCAMVACFAAKAEKAGGECGDDGDEVYWSVSDDGTTLSFTGEGWVADYNNLTTISESYPWLTFGPQTPWYQYREGITTVTIGSDVDLVGFGCFYGLDNLQSIEVDEDNGNLKSVDGVVYNKAMTCLFYYPTGKAGAYTIPATVQYLSEGAFLGCKGLTEVTFAEGCKAVIPFRTFEWCTSLKKVNLVPSCPGIEVRAFRGCSSLESVFIHKNTNVSNGAFADCGSLKEITIEEGHLNSVSIDGIHYQVSEGKLICENYPMGKDLTNLVFPENVTVVSNAALFHAAKLESITLPSGMTTICEDAFVGCTGLKSIICMSETPPAFMIIQKNYPLYPTYGIDTENCVIYVPEGCVEAYKAATIWKEFAHIEEYKDAPTAVTDLSTGVNTPVNVYNMCGMLVRSNVMSGEATQGLPQGIYVVGNKKVVVR